MPRQESATIHAAAGNAQELTNSKKMYFATTGRATHE